MSEESAYDEDEEELCQLPNKGQEPSNPKDNTDTVEDEECVKKDGKEAE